MSASERSDPIFNAPAAAVAPARPTRVRHRVLFAACCLAVITYLHRVGFATASAEFKGPLGLDDRDLSYLMAAFLGAYGVFEVPWGLVGDRVGARHLLAVVALGGSLTTGAVALVALLPAGTAWPLAFLLALRLLFGLFQAGTFPAISRMMADWMPIDERGSAQGLVWMSSRMGGTLAPLVLVPLFAALGDWRSPLVIVAALGLAWCLAFWPWFRDRPEQMAQVGAAELARIAEGRADRAPAGHERVPWGRMARSRSVWALCLMYGCLAYSGNFFLTLLPTYLRNHRHLEPGATGLLTSLPFACGIAACAAGGLLSDAIIRRLGDRRWGRRLVGAAGLAVAGAAIAAVPWVDDTRLLAALLCLTFAGNDLAMGPAWAAVADIGERHAGTLGGAMNMLGSFTAAAAALITGRLFHHHQLTLPFLLFAGSYALGVLCWLGVDTTKTLAEG